MKHRDHAATVDAPSRSRPADTRHRWDNTHQNKSMELEEAAYRMWCHDRTVDPDDPHSAAQYEREVGMLYT